MNASCIACSERPPTGDHRPPAHSYERQVGNGVAIMRRPLLIHRFFFRHRSFSSDSSEASRSSDRMRHTFRVVSRERVPEPMPSGIQTRLQDVLRVDHRVAGATSNPPLSLLWRDFDAQLERWLIENASNRSASGVWLRGPQGAGKSVSTFQAVQRARERGWLVLYLPNAFQWVHGAGLFSGVYERGIEGVLNMEIPFYYDRPSYVLSLMRDFRAAHESDLAALNCVSVDEIERETELDSTGDEKRMELESSGRYRTLLDVVDEILAEEERMGTDFYQDAMSLIGTRFRVLLRQLQRVRDVPVMVAIDQWNHLNGVSSFGHPSRARHWIHASALRSTRPLNIWNVYNTFGARMRYGLVLCAETSLPGRVHVRASRVIGSLRHPPTEEMRRQPDGLRMGQQILDDSNRLPTGSVVMNVPLFSRHECFKLIRDFEQHHMLRCKDDTVLWRLHELAGGSATRLVHLCRAV